MYRRQLLTGLLMTIALVVVLGVLYPLAVTAVGQVAFHDKANGSMVQRNGKDVGSSLIGQNFTTADGSPDPRYFQPRPSAAGENGYDGKASSPSNLGPSNQDLLDAVAQRADAYRKLNGLPSDAKVPVDAVTASGSGLDPGISVANARLQAPRVAKERHLSEAAVLQAIDRHTESRQLGFLGERQVNVLELNLDLDGR
jgi:K+-transporting ATPase ATPase C chain